MFAPGATAQLDERTTQAFAMQEQRIDAAPAEVPTLQRGFIDAPVIEVDLTSGTERIMTLAPQPQAPAAYTAAAAPPPMKMRVTVPAGSSPGQQLSVQTARGLMTVVVPADAHSGQSFDFVLPSDRPDDTAMSPPGMLRVPVPAHVYGGQPRPAPTPTRQRAQRTVPPGRPPGPGRDPPAPPAAHTPRAAPRRHLSTVWHTERWGIGVLAPGEHARTVQCFLFYAQSRAGTLGETRSAPLCVGFSRQP